MRPGSFDAAKVAREFCELRCRGIGTDRFAGAIQIEAAHFAGREPRNQFQGCGGGLQPLFFKAKRPPACQSAVFSVQLSAFYGCN
jgi:hypothetical protein